MIWIKKEWEQGKGFFGFIKAILIWIIIFVVLWLGFQILHYFAPNRWTYAIKYDVSIDKVAIDSKPVDCDFFAAPIGKKGCHYEREVVIVRWGRSAENNAPVISYDNGESWNNYYPESGEYAPQQSTIKAVNVYWIRKEGD